MSEHARLPEPDPNPSICPSCGEWVDAMVYDPTRGWMNKWGQVTAMCCVACYEDQHGPIPDEPADETVPF